MSREPKPEKDHITILRGALMMPAGVKHIDIDIDTLPPAGDGNAWAPGALALFSIARHCASRVGYHPSAQWTGDGWLLTWLDADGEGPEDSLTPLLADEWFPTSRTVSAEQLEALGFDLLKAST